MNAEIEHIYKTRDWRIAQVSGLTKADPGPAKPEHQQYPYSQASWAFIGGVLATNKQLLAEDSQPNIATIAYEKHGMEGIQAVQAALKNVCLLIKIHPVDHNFNVTFMAPVFKGYLIFKKHFISI